MLLVGLLVAGAWLETRFVVRAERFAKIELLVSGTTDAETVEREVAVLLAPVNNLLPRRTFNRS